MKKVLIVVLVLVILGGGAFALSKNGNKTDDNTASSAPSTTQTDQTSTPATNDSSATDTSNQAPANATNVQIKDFSFNPTKLTVKVGTTVTWTQMDDTQHDVVPDQDYGDAFKGSDLLSKGKTYSFTFTKAGTYNYHCNPHPYMKGTIEVTN